MAKRPDSLKNKVQLGICGRRRPNKNLPTRASKAKQEYANTMPICSNSIYTTEGEGHGSCTANCIRIYGPGVGILLFGL